MFASTQSNLLSNTLPNARSLGETQELMNVVTDACRLLNSSHWQACATHPSRHWGHPHHSSSLHLMRRVVHRFGFQEGECSCPRQATNVNVSPADARDTTVVISATTTIAYAVLGPRGRSKFQQHTQVYTVTHRITLRKRNALTDLRQSAPLIATAPITSLEGHAHSFHLALACRCSTGHYKCCNDCSRCNRKQQHRSGHRAGLTAC